MGPHNMKNITWKQEIGGVLTITKGTHMMDMMKMLGIEHPISLTKCQLKVAKMV
jgi:hypothetical protein